MSQRELKTGEVNCLMILSLYFILKDARHYIQFDPDVQARTEDISQGELENSHVIMGAQDDGFGLGLTPDQDFEKRPDSPDPTFKKKPDPDLTLEKNRFYLIKLTFDFFLST